MRIRSQNQSLIQKKNNLVSNRAARNSNHIVGWNIGYWSRTAPDFVKSSVKSFTKLQNKFFEFRASVERDIGAEDLKQDIFNELKMEELERDDEPPK